MDKIYVAKLGRTTGLKGEQKIYIDSDFPEQFKKGSKYITDKNQELIIERFNPKSNTIKFEGIDDINSAKKLTNRLLYTSIQDTKEHCKLEDKEFFWFDIIECEIIEDNESLGIVSDIQRLPLSDYLVIDTSKKLIDQKLANRFLLPYLEQYILNVDLENKKIFTQNAKDILEAS